MTYFYYRATFYTIRNANCDFKSKLCVLQTFEVLRVFVCLFFDKTSDSETVSNWSCSCYRFKPLNEPKTPELAEGWLS